MNILYVSNEYPSETSIGGIGTYTKNSAEGMASLGHTVHVICRSSSAHHSPTTQNGVFVHRCAPGTFPLPRHRLFYYLRCWCRRAIPHSLERLAWAREAYSVYRSLLRQGLRFDIIEYPECGGEGYYFSKARDSIRVARLHTPWEIVRSLDTISEGACDRLALSHIERSTVRRCSAITSPTHALATLLQSRWGLKTIRVFPNPLPVSHYPLATGSDWIYTGRVEYRKGVHTLIEAYELLTQTSRPPRLRLIGKPYGNHPNGSDYGKYIADRIGRLQYPENIEWIRGMPGASIPEQLQKSAAAIFPSLWENLSYSCIEAMASGLAIVASRTGGYPEIITECETGLLFQPGNSADLAAQLAKLLAQPHLRKDLGINARKKASELFDTPLVCRTMVAFYEDLKRMGS